MLSRYRNTNVLIFFFTFVLMMSLLVFRNMEGTVKAQQNDLSLRLLLERLDRAVDNEEKEVYFKFLSPLSGDDVEWIIPTVDSEAGYISRTISEIGDDYLCFDERLGEIIMAHCTPFSNIVSVSYITTPE